MVNSNGFCHQCFFDSSYRIDTHIVLPTDPELGKCIEKVLPSNECAGDADCHKEITNAYAIDKYEFHFTNTTYLDTEVWALKCNDNIFTGSKARLPTFATQTGTYEVQELSDHLCQVTFIPTVDTCRAYWKTGDGKGEDMCNTCGDACRDCDGHWHSTSNSYYCQSQDDKYFLQARCPTICPFFELEDVRVQNFLFEDENCTQMTTNYKGYNTTFVYFSGASSIHFSSVIFLLYLFSLF